MAASEGTAPASKSELYLVRKIGVFFADALRTELNRSGYRTTKPNDHIVSCTITRWRWAGTRRSEKGF
ncbi:MAG: hypothetical protein OEV38_20560 [Nitrospira sp.]|nr:hypothetical protein [Nitrospira sp.]